MERNNQNFLSVFLALIKFKVSIPVTFLCFAGYYLFAGSIHSETWFSSLGVFLLSSASSVWNQVIERNYDKLMDRTKYRPLPSHQITKQTAHIIAILLLISGSTMLLYISFISLLLGIFAVFWYLMIYTLLKRKTAFATIPGALTGALPLLIGWTAAGGYFLEPYILFIGFFVLIWQIPHFWLLMMIFNDDYQKAGFPTISQTFSRYNTKLWTLAWIVILVLSAAVLPGLLIIPGALIKIIIGIPGLLVLYYSGYVLIYRKGFNRKSVFALFLILNNFMLLVIVILLLFR